MRSLPLWRGRWPALAAHLRKVSVLEVGPRHAVQPGAAQFGGAGVRARQAVLQVQQHLGVPLVLPHLRSGHQHRPDAHGQALHLRGERSHLRRHGKPEARVTLVASCTHDSHAHVYRDLPGGSQSEKMAVWTIAAWKGFPVVL